MGKLNIAHHKSYHPYRRDNIERVRKDEEEARQKEAREEGRMMLADSEARIDRLRERAGAQRTGKHKDADDLAELTGDSTVPGSLMASGGHINFFEDLEHQSMTAAIKASKKSAPAETEKGVALAPSAKDLKPWYSESSDERQQDIAEERRMRDLAHKTMNDPLTSITHQLASRPSSSSASHRPRPLRHTLPSSAPPEVHARLNRESSERQRALDLIRRKKKEMEGSETPSTVHGGYQGGYGDVFNRQEVEDAHRGRDRRWDAWDRDRDRDRDRGWIRDDRGRNGHGRHRR